MAKNEKNVNQKETIKEEAYLADVAQEEVKAVEQEALSTEALIPVLGDFNPVDDISKTQAQNHIKALVQMTEFIGKEAINFDSLANREITVVGAVKHPATVRSRETGELQEVNRIVILLDDGTTVGAVSIAIENFFNTCIFPAFGMGRWKDKTGAPISLKMKVIPVSTNSGGRSYNIQVVG